MYEVVSYQSASQFFFNETSIYLNVFCPVLAYKIMSNIKSQFIFSK